MTKKMSADTNSINWFETAVKDIARAKKFYEKNLDVELTPMEMMGMKMAMFPYDGTKGKVGGALVESQMHTPGKTGSVVYLNANLDLKSGLSRVEKPVEKYQCQKL